MPTLTVYQVVNGIPACAKSQVIVTFLEQRSGQFGWADTVFAGNWLRAGMASLPVADTRADLLPHPAIMQRAGMPLLAGMDILDDNRSRLLPGFTVHAEFAIYMGRGPVAARSSGQNTPILIKALCSLETNSVGSMQTGKLLSVMR